MILEFNSIKDDLMRILSEKQLGIQEPCELFQGLFDTVYCRETRKSFPIGGPTVPMVCLIGEKTGRIYWFALGKLMPELWKDQE